MKLSFIIILCSLSFKLLSQPVYFNKQYIDPETYWGIGKTILNINNGYLLCGIGSGYNGWNNKNVILCFLDEQGNPKQWKHYGEITHHYYPAGLGSMIHTTDSGYALPVYTVQGDCYTAYLFRFDNNGDTLWTNIYGNLQAQDYCHTQIFQILQNESKDFIMTGAQHPFGEEHTDILLIEADSMGNEQWQMMYGTNWVERGLSLIEAPDKGYLIGGYKYMLGLNYSGDAIVLKTDSLGNEQWQRTYGGELKDCGACVEQSHDSNFIIGYGHAYEEPVPGHPFRKMTFLKIDNNGDTIWHRQFGRIDLGNCVSKIIRTNDGNYVAVGSTCSDPNALILGWLFKFSDNGDSIWYRTYRYHQGIHEHFLNDVDLANDGGFVMCGQAIWMQYPIPPNPQQMWVIKVDSIGCPWPNCDSVGTIIIPAEQDNWFENSSIIISPNPNNGVFKVMLNTLFISSTRLEIYNLLGEKVYQTEVAGSTSEISVDLKGQKSGMYLVRLLKNNRVVANKKMLLRH